MQSSFFEPGRPVIFARSTSEHVDATVKGSSEKGDQFAVLEHMKAGLLDTQPCAPPFKEIEFFIWSPSPSPEPTSPPPPSPVAEVRAKPEVVAQPCQTLSCVCMPLGTWVEIDLHSYSMLTHVCVGGCMCRAQATPVSKL